MRIVTDREAAALLGLEDSVLPAWIQGVVITDPSLPDNPIIYANRGFELLTGYARTEIIGRNCRFLQGPGTKQSTIAAIRMAVAEQRRFDGDILNYRRDGTPFWNYLSLGPVVTATGPLLAGLQFDVTFRHRDEE